MTPLLMAITNAQVPVAQLLVERGADVRAADWWGRTPLWAAVEIRNLDLRSGAVDNGVDRAAALRLVEAILAKGVDVNARVQEFPPQRRHLLPLASLEWVDFTGQTAFVRAAQSADVPVMRLLLANGADPAITTFNGTSALMAAAGVNWVAGQTFSESPDGNQHNYSPLPIVLAGSASGRLKGGRHLQFPRDTPMSNLLAAMLTALGVPTATFGDGTGVLEI